MGAILAEPQHLKAKDENSGRPAALADHLLEHEVMDAVVRIVQFVGLPRSVGELYAALYVSPSPLHMDELREMLDMSKGSASQGLKLLREIGAIRTVYQKGDRRDFFEAETNLKFLVEGFMKHRVEPAFADMGKRIESLKIAQGSNGGNHDLQHRIDKLNKWHRQAEAILPAIEKVLVG